MTLASQMQGQERFRHSTRQLCLRGAYTHRRLARTQSGHTAAPLGPVLAVLTVLQTDTGVGVEAEPSQASSNALRHRRQQRRPSSRVTPSSAAHVPQTQREHAIFHTECSIAHVRNSVLEVGDLASSFLHALADATAVVFAHSERIASTLDLKQHWNQSTK
jgi:hypothetical protein